MILLTSQLLFESAGQRVLTSIVYDEVDNRFVKITQKISAELTQDLSSPNPMVNIMEVISLDYVDYVFTEVNQDEVYENNANILDLDSYLSRWNFTRVETTWEGGVWGDALYIKNYVG